MPFFSKEKDEQSPMDRRPAAASGTDDPEFASLGEELEEAPSDMSVGILLSGI